MKYNRSGPDVNPWKQRAADANLSAYNSPSFKKACDTAGIPVTTRQASKYAKKKGVAYASK